MTADSVALPVLWKAAGRKGELSGSSGKSESAGSGWKPFWEVDGTWL